MIHASFFSNLIRGLGGTGFVSQPNWITIRKPGGTAVFSQMRRGQPSTSEEQPSSKSSDSRARGSGGDGALDTGGGCASGVTPPVAGAICVVPLSIAGSKVTRPSLPPSLSPPLSLYLQAAALTACRLAPGGFSDRMSVLKGFGPSDWPA